jgi:hypothetical protein
MFATTSARPKDPKASYTDQSQRRQIHPAEVGVLCNAMHEGVVQVATDKPPSTCRGQIQEAHHLLPYSGEAEVPFGGN